MMFDRNRRQKGQRGQEGTTSYSKALEKHGGKDLPAALQKAFGKPREISLAEKHDIFLKTVIGLMDSHTIDMKNPASLRKEAVYRKLSPEWQRKVDIVVPNIITLLERIMDLHARPENDASVEMQHLIDTLWQAKRRIEKHVDVFVF